LSEFTVLHAEGYQLRKVWRDGSALKTRFPAAWEFAHSEWEGLHALHNVLAALATEPERCITRGRATVDSGGRSRETISDVPRDWACFDVDGAPESVAGAFEADPEGEIARVVAGAWGSGVGYVWRVSGSAGVREGIRVHLYMMLDRPVTNTELAAAYAAAPEWVDKSVLSDATKILYTCDPDVDEGGWDGERLGLIEGRALVVPAVRKVGAALKSLGLSSYSADVTAGLAAWTAGRAPLRADERIEPCPGCGSSDGCHVMADGVKLLCHGKHTKNAGGAQAGESWVGHPFEFAYRVCGEKAIRAKLIELGMCPSPEAARAEKGLPTYSCGKDRQPKVTFMNAVLAVAHESVSAHLHWDRLRHEPAWHSEPAWRSASRAGEPCSDADIYDLTRHMATTLGFDTAKTGLVREAFLAVAAQDVRDPLTEYYQARRDAAAARGLTVAEAERFFTGLPRTWFNLEPTHYRVEWIKRYMMAHVYRAGATAVEPRKGKQVFTLRGGQNALKSEFVYAISWDASLVLESFDVRGGVEANKTLRGKHFVELPECDALISARGSELARVKEGISRRTDTYRASFAHAAKDYPRRIMFTGSTNAEACFTDAENVRWVVLDIEDAVIQCDNVRALRDEAWECAVVLHDATPDQCYLFGAAAEEAARVAERMRFETEAEEVVRNLLLHGLRRHTGPGASTGLQSGQTAADGGLNWISVQHLRQLLANTRISPTEVRAVAKRAGFVRVDRLGVWAAADNRHAGYVRVGFTPPEATKPLIS
jgi:hypothetical protein